ncbi:MAG: diaminopimelate epimerase [Candidatus Zixiibacteriota bacterium]
MKIAFSKYQALGNSFIVLDEIVENGRLKRFETLAQKICHPTQGIGADGILVVSGQKPAYRVDIYNADGSWAEKSGNGIRIAAMFLLNKGLVSEKEVSLETGSGTSVIQFKAGSDKKRAIGASLGKPVFEAAKIPVKTELKYFINQTLEMDKRQLIVSAVSVGNPHLILFCDDFDFDWQSIGADLEVHDLFPNRINVGFVSVKDAENIDVRDFERGVGPTESSGTGAAAAVAIAVMRGFTDRKVNVHTQAGILQVLWDDKTDEISIQGPVEFIGAGEFEA